MLPPVVVQIAPPEADARLVETLVEACSRVVPDTECVLGDPDGGPSTATVQVTFVTDAEVELEVVLGEQGTRFERVLRFREEDETVERYRAIGLVVGTLAGGVDDTEAAGPAPPEPDAPPTGRADAPPPEDEAAPPPPPHPPPPPPEQPPPRRPAPSTVAKPFRRAGWVAALGNAGPGFDDGVWRLGGGLDGGVRFGAFVLGLTAGYARTVGDVEHVSGTWWFGALGAGALLEATDRLDVSLRADGVLQRLETSATNPASEETDSGGRFVPGGRAVLDVTGWLLPEVGLTLSGELRLLASATDVRTAGRVAVTESRLRGTMWAGLKYAF